MFIVTKKSGGRDHWSLYEYRGAARVYLCALPRAVFKRKPSVGAAQKYFASLDHQRLVDAFSSAVVFERHLRRQLNQHRRKRREMQRRLAGLALAPALRRRVDQLSLALNSRLNGPKAGVILIRDDLPSR